MYTFIKQVTPNLPVAYSLIIDCDNVSSSWKVYVSSITGDLTN